MNMMQRFHVLLVAVAVGAGCAKTEVAREERSASTTDALETAPTTETENAAEATASSEGSEPGATNGEAADRRVHVKVQETPPEPYESDFITFEEPKVDLEKVARRVVY